MVLLSCNGSTGVVLVCCSCTGSYTLYLCRFVSRVEEVLGDWKLTESSVGRPSTVKVSGSPESSWCPVSSVCR